MDYKEVIKDEIEDFINKFPEYSFTEIIYSALLMAKITNRNELLKLSDKDFYTALNQTKKNEREDEFTEKDIELITNK